VHGHSSHHPLAIEVHRCRLILYGRGDPINDYEGIGAHVSLRSDVGCLYFVTPSLPGGALRRVEIVPMRLRHFRLERADDEARRCVTRLHNEGDEALGTKVVPARGGGLALQRTRAPAP